MRSRGKLFQFGALAVGAIVMSACSTVISGQGAVDPTGLAELTTTASSTSTASQTSSSATTPETTASTTGALTIPPTSASPPSTPTTTKPAVTSTSPTGPVTVAALVRDGVAVRPKVKRGGAVTIADVNGFADYNNSADTEQLDEGSQMSALVQPSAFLVYDEFSVAMDGDLLTSAKVTKTAPETVVYQINPRAVWSDGAPVDCHDFYLQWLVGASAATVADESAFKSSFFGNYTVMNAPVCSGSSKIVTVTFNSPDGNWQEFFNSLLPAHVLEKQTGIDVTSIKSAATSGAVLTLAAAYVKDFDGFQPKFALSAGPYEIASLTSAKTVLVPNPKWWGNPPGPASVTFVNTGSAEGQIQMLTSGGAQVAAPNASQQTVTGAKALPNSHYSVRSGAGFLHIDFNLNRPLFKGTAGLALRKAVLFCVNRSTIAADTPSGVSSKLVGNEFFVPGSPGYVDLYSKYLTSNVATARQIMVAGGWKMGTDGLYTLGATKAKFSLGHLPNADRTEISQLAGVGCRQAGIEIDDQTASDFNSNALVKGTYDAALFAWLKTPFATDLVSSFTTGANFQNYSNKGVDDLLASAVGQLDTTKRNATLNTAGRTVAAEFVTIPLVQENNLVVQVGGASAAGAAPSFGVPLSYNDFYGGVAWNAFEWVVGR